jgi:methionyl-tRNA formyltransferase
MTSRRPRLAFFGTPDFAVAILRALCAAGHVPAAVYCQPPRRAGRGKQERPSAVHAYAGANGLAVRTPVSLRDAAELAAFRVLEPDLAVVAAYGLIFPADFLAVPPLGCINVHASLLPRWRGAAPIQRAILAGDSETGVTIMRMEEGLDTGAMLLREAVAIEAGDDSGTLHDKLAMLGGRLAVAAVEGLAAGTLRAAPQPVDGVSYAAKIANAETRLDWSRPAVELARQVRAFAPAPGAWFDLDGERIRVLAADTTGDGGAPGTVLDDRLTVACATGALRPVMVQRAGKGAMTTGAFLRGRPVAEGTRLP